MSQRPQQPGHRINTRDRPPRNRLPVRGDGPGYRLVVPRPQADRPRQLPRSAPYPLSRSSA